MGTMIQRHGLSEEDFRGERFADWEQDVRGNSDMLSLTQPDVIRSIHREYLEAGADIVETNTFSAQRISQADYGMQDLAYEMNFESARLAREACDAVTAETPDRPRWVIGALGPDEHHGLDLAGRQRPRQAQHHLRPARRGLPRAGPRPRRRRRRPAARRDDLRHPQRQGRDLRAGDAVRGARAAAGRSIISGTITDASGRTLSGQVTEAFWNSVRHARPLAVGLNCALGAAEMRPYVAELSRVADTFVSCYPNAGLPNEFGEYDETPDQTAAVLEEFASSGLVNLLGGCCGTTPEHIEAIARASKGKSPREVPEIEPALRLSGLEPVTITDESLFVNVGERTNITGLGALPPPDQGRRLQRRAHGGAAAGRGGRSGHRHQHGRGHDRRRRGDGPLRQADRQRARHLPRPADGRLLEVRGHRGRPQVRAGQADRQLHLDEGGRGQVPRAGPAVPQVRRRGRRDGLRRGRPGRQPRSSQGDLPAGLRHPRRRGRLPGRGHHLRPEHLRDRDRHRGARQLRRGLHRGHPLDQAEPPRRAGLRRRLQRLLLVPRQQPGARGDPRGLPLPRDPRRHGHGNRERRPARGLRRDRREAARAHRGRRAQPPRRQHRAAARDRTRLRRRRRRAGRPRPRSGDRCRSASASPTRWSRASTTTPSPTPRSCARRSPSAAAGRSRSSRAR